jgi:hypothetical protein
MAIREGRWRCPYCASPNRGRHLACSACGATRDADVSFYLEPDAPEVVERTLIARAVSGADWPCSFCGNSNPAVAETCAACGAARGGATALRVAPLPPARPAAEAQPSPRRGWLWGVVALALLLALALAVLAFRTHEETVSVVGFQWRRAIDVEAYRTVRETAWQGEEPAGVRVVSRSRERHHAERVAAGSERVKVGTRDLGNGFFEDVYEERPKYEEREVFRDRVTYEQERWVADRTERSEGDDQIPRWPALRLAPRQREAGRSESYAVLLRGRKVYVMELPKERWSELREGESRTAVVRGGRRVIALR